MQFCAAVSTKFTEFFDIFFDSVIRKTNNYIIAQLVEFNPEGDRTVVHVNSRDLEKFGWKTGKKNLPAAYLTGLLAGVKAKKLKIDKAILDIGFAIPRRKGWWASALKGALDAGLKMPAGEKALPSDERISGKHIELFAKKQVTKTFEEAKQKIMHLK